MPRFAALLILACSTAVAQHVPEWVLDGIAKVETGSYYSQDGRLHWVDRRRGAHGELGAFQMTPAAFATIRLPGERFQDLTDTRFAEVACRRYLERLFLTSANRSWALAIQQYNAGPGRRSLAYLKRVQDAV